MPANKELFEGSLLINNSDNGVSRDDSSINPTTGKITNVPIIKIP